MQSHNENEKQRSGPESTSAQETELSAAFRALLGLSSHTEASDEARQVDPSAQVQPQSSDPWSELVRVRGMETVDLQKIRLRELFPTASDEDVEHALNIMQEANGQSSSQEKPGQS